MGEVESYPAGHPSWVDISSPDTKATGAFYGAIFGWDLEDLGPEAGGYGMFRKGGKQVGGVGPIMAEGQPSAWMTYIAVDNADETAAKVAAAGGATLSPPMDVMDVGRMAVFADPTGAAISVWQAGTHKGAEIKDEPGTFCWHELWTRDTEAAKAFYGNVFGWGAETNPFGHGSYTEWKHGEGSIGGMMDMPPDVPAEVPAHWIVYFAVDDADATIVAATDLGGSTIVPATDIPPGRFAVLRDPAGAVFAIISPPQEESGEG